MCEFESMVVMPNEGRMTGADQRAWLRCHYQYHGQPQGQGRIWGWTPPNPIQKWDFMEMGELLPKFRETQMGTWHMRGGRGRLRKSRTYSRGFSAMAPLW